MPTSGGPPWSGSIGAGCSTSPPSSRRCAVAPRTPTPRFAGPHSCWRSTRASGCSRSCDRATRSCSGSSSSWKAGPGTSRSAPLAGGSTPALPSETPGEPSGKKKAKAAKATARATAEPSLDDADFEPLLQATASRALDTSLRGARGLAILGDPRAFGLLAPAQPRGGQDGPRRGLPGDGRARRPARRRAAPLDAPRPGGRGPRRRLHGDGAAPPGRPAGRRRVGPERLARGRAPSRSPGPGRAGPQGPGRGSGRARPGAAGPRPQRQLPGDPVRGVQVGAGARGGRGRRGHAPVRLAERPRGRPPRGAHRGDGPGRASPGAGTSCWSSSTTPTRHSAARRSNSPSRRPRGSSCSRRRWPRATPTFASGRWTSWSRSTRPRRRRCSSGRSTTRTATVRLAAIESLVDADALPALAEAVEQRASGRPTQGRQGVRPARRLPGPGAAPRAGDGPRAGRAGAAGRLGQAGRVGPRRARRAGRPVGADAPDPVAGQHAPGDSPPGGAGPGLGLAARDDRRPPPGAPARRPGREVPRRQGPGLHRRRLGGPAGLLRGGRQGREHRRADRRGPGDRRRGRGPARRLSRRSARRGPLARLDPA